MSNQAKAVLIVSLCILLLGVVAVTRQQSKNTSSKTVSLLPDQITGVPPTQPNNDISNVHSPDGVMNATIVRVKNTDGRMAYSLSVAEVGKAGKKIFQATPPVGYTMSLSPNSWSPDNGYLFILEQTPSGPNALVFTVDGSPFSNGDPFVDVAVKFRQSVLEYTLRDITGWDAPGLLHLFTYDTKNAKGPAFWFELGSNAAIALY